MVVSDPVLHPDASAQKPFLFCAGKTNWKCLSLCLASGVFVDSLLKLKLLRITPPHFSGKSTSLPVMYLNVVEKVQSLMHSCMSLFGGIRFYMQMSTTVNMYLNMLCT